MPLGGPGGMREAKPIFNGRRKEKPSADYKSLA